MSYRNMMERQYLDMLPTHVDIKGVLKTNTVYVDGKKLPLRHSQNVRNHSSDGFNWGYGGSGPAQFALALLMKYLPKEVALEYYQLLKFKFIAGLPQSDFEVSVNLRETMISAIEAIVK